VAGDLNLDGASDGYFAFLACFVCGIVLLIFRSVEADMKDAALGILTIVHNRYNVVPPDCVHLC
jgi:hypothetical protein